MILNSDVGGGCLTDLKVVEVQGDGRWNQRSRTFTDAYDGAASRQDEGQELAG